MEEGSAGVSFWEGQGSAKGNSVLNTVLRKCQALLPMNSSIRRQSRDLTQVCLTTDLICAAFELAGKRPKILTLFISQHPGVLSASVCLIFVVHCGQ